MAQQLMSPFLFTACISLCLAAGCDLPLFSFVPVPSPNDIVLNRPQDNPPYNFSDFTRFELKQYFGYGSCPANPYHVSIERSGSEYSYTASVFVAFAPREFECSDPAQSGDCIIVRNIGPRLLSDQEVATLIDVFSSIATSPNECSYPDDRCRIDIFTWDEFHLDAGPNCGRIVLADQTVDDLLTFLDELAAN